MQRHHTEETIALPPIAVENATAASQTRGIEATEAQEFSVLETAERSVNEKQSATFEQASAGIRNEVRSLRRRNLRFAIVIGLVSVAVSMIGPLLQILMLMRFTPTLQQVEIAACVLLVCFATLAIYTIAIFTRSTGKRRLKRRGKIAAIADIRLVGSLVDILAIGSPHEHTMAKETLTRLLPNLKASDFALLSHAQRRQLDRCLMPRLHNKSKSEQQRDTDFQLAILSGYEQVGDIDSWSAVGSLAYPAPEYLMSTSPEVSAAARRCLQFLEYLAAQQRASMEQYRISSQLLRPSSASAVSQEMLLRPAMNRTTVDESDSLLRATNETAFPPAASGKRDA